MIRRLKNRRCSLSRPARTGYDKDIDETMFDIAITGLGPVGATLANFLGRDGWRVAVIESAFGVVPIPRAVHCDDEAQRIWQAAGLLDFVTPSFGGYPPDRQYINARGEVFFETHLNTAKPYGYQGNMYFHQPTLEAGLREGLARFENVELFLGRSAIGFEQEVDGVTLQLRNHQTETDDLLRAKYLVGCDGASSFVRKSLGIPLQDLKFEQPWLVTDFYLKPGLTREDVGFPYAHQQICDPAQPISFIPNGSKSHYRFEFMLPEDVTKDDAEKEAYVHKMLAPLVDLEKIDIVRGTVYTFHSLIATRWREGRVFIAGDAAHQMPPFAGQGMCSGLRDAHNLSWKLDMVLADRAEDALLDSYELERKPHVTRMTKGAMFLGNLVQTPNLVRAWLRDLLFRTIFRVPAIFGRIARFALLPPTLKTTLCGGTIKEVVGTYFIQPEVSDAAGNIRLLDTLFGSTMAVVGMGLDPKPYFQSLNHKLPLCCLEIVSERLHKEGARHEAQETAQIFDHTGQLALWFAQHKVDFVVVRPDRFVFGAYSLDNVSDAVDELSAQLRLCH